MYKIHGYESANAGGGKATIQVGDKAPVSLPDAGWGTDYNQMEQPLGDFAGITADGTYTIYFPAGYFNLGDNGDPSPEMTVVYTIGEEQPSYPAIITPTPGSTLVSLPAAIDLKFAGYEEAGIGSGRATIQFEDETPKSLPDPYLDPVDYEAVAQRLGDYADAKTPGKYTITFPAGYFNLGSNGESSPEMVVVYIVEKPANEYPATIDPTPGSTMEALPDDITLTFTGYKEAGLGGGHATIQFESEDPQNLPDLKYHPKDYEAVIQNLGEYAGATNIGVYTITFPEGYVNLGYNGETSPEMVITYTVNNNTGVAGVTIKADRYMVFDLNGVKVLDTTDADALKALKGLYIVNGVKVVLK